MIDLVTDNLEAVRQLCVKYHVAKMWLFGSATNGEFDLERSDIDFLIQARLKNWCVGSSDRTC